MMASTIVGMFDDGSRARAAATDLAGLGVSDSNITVTQSDPQNVYTAYQGTASSSDKVGGGISGFFKSLFGGDVNDDDTSLYSEALRRGTTVVTASVEDTMLDDAVEIFSRHGAIDIDRLANQYRSTGYRTFDESAPIYTPEQSRTDWEAFRAQREVALPVVEEELQ